MGDAPVLHHQAAAPVPKSRSLVPGSFLLKFIEDETGDVTYLHLPVPLSAGHVLSYVVEAGKVARQLYNSFKPIGEDAEAILDDLPFE